MMVSTLPKIIYQGTKILVRSIGRSILEEIQLSRQAASVRYKEKKLTCSSSNVKQVMSLDEAMRILDVEKLNAEEVEEKFKYLFQVNSRTQGGSFYLQSKIFRAKERIDSELNGVALKNDVNFRNK